MHPLVGAWSSEASGLHYSSAENETLVLAGDGTGSMHFARPDYTDVVRLTWREPRPGQLTLAYGARREIAHGVVRDLPTATLPTLIRYRISREDTPLAGRMTLLRLEPPIMLASVFGLQTR